MEVEWKQKMQWNIVSVIISDPKREVVADQMKPTWQAIKRITKCSLNEICAQQ